MSAQVIHVYLSDATKQGSQGTYYMSRGFISLAVSLFIKAGCESRRNGRSAIRQVWKVRSCVTSAHPKSIRRAGRKHCSRHRNPGYRFSCTCWWREPSTSEGPRQAYGICGPSRSGRCNALRGTQKAADIPTSLQRSVKSHTTVCDTLKRSISRY